MRGGLSPIFVNNLGWSPLIGPVKQKKIKAKLHCDVLLFTQHSTFYSASAELLFVFLYQRESVSMIRFED